MSTPISFPENSAWNAYQSPDYASAAADAAQAMRRPGWLTAVCIVSILLGVLGILLVLAGTAGLVINGAFREQLSKQQQVGGPAQIVEIQQQFQKKTYAIADRYFWSDVVLLPITAIVSIFLLVAGILGFRYRPLNRTLLIGALAATLVIVVVSGVKGALQTYEVSNAVSEMQEQANAQAPPAPAAPANAQAEAASMMLAFMRAGLIVGAIFSFGWYLVQLLFCGLSIRYLTRPKIVALYASAPLQTQPYAQY